MRENGAYYIDQTYIIPLHEHAIAESVKCDWHTEFVADMSMHLLPQAGPLKIEMIIETV